MKPSTLLACAIVALAASPAQALTFAPGKGPFANCPIPAGYHAVTSRADLPSDLKLEGWAMPGERWNPTDVAQPGVPGRGMLFNWNKGNSWIVGEGIGGIGLRMQVRAYEIGQKNFWFGSSNPQETLCDQAHRLAE